MSSPTVNREEEVLDLVDRHYLHPGRPADYEPPDFSDSSDDVANDLSQAQEDEASERHQLQAAAAVRSLYQTVYQIMKRLRPWLPLNYTAVHIMLPEATAHVISMAGMIVFFPFLKAASRDEFLRVREAELNDALAGFAIMERAKNFDPDRAESAWQAGRQRNLRPGETLADVTFAEATGISFVAYFVVGEGLSYQNQSDVNRDRTQSVGAVIRKFGQIIADRFFGPDLYIRFYDEGMRDPLIATAALKNAIEGLRLEQKGGRQVIQVDDPGNPRALAAYGRYLRASGLPISSLQSADFADPHMLEIVRESYGLEIEPHAALDAYASSQVILREQTHGVDVDDDGLFRERHLPH